MRSGALLQGAPPPPIVHSTASPDRRRLEYFLAQQHYTVCVRDPPHSVLAPMRALVAASAPSQHARAPQSLGGRRRDGAKRSQRENLAARAPNRRLVTSWFI